MLDRASEICEVSGSDRAPGICRIFRGVARHGIGACRRLLGHSAAPAAQIAGTRGGSCGGFGRFGGILGLLWAARAMLAACFGGRGGTCSFLWDSLGLLEGSFAAAGSGSGG